MPYICADCGYVFEKPKKYTEKSPGEDIAFDEWYGCPDCGSDSYYTAHVHIPASCRYLRKISTIGYTCFSNMSNYASRTSG